MKDTQPLPPEDFIPESLRAPRHRPVFQVKQARASTPAWNAWVIGLALGSVPLCLVFSAIGGGWATVGQVVLTIYGVVIGLAIYLLPTILAVMGDKTNWVAIAALNILLGWTFVGWVVALVWSLTKDRSR